MLPFLLCTTLLLGLPSAARAMRVESTLEGLSEPTGPPDELAERSEEQTVSRKCMGKPAQLGEVSRPGAASLSELSYERPEETGRPGTPVRMTARDVVDGLWHSNTSVLDLLEHGIAAFDDYRCDKQELAAFRKEFGLDDLKKKNGLEGSCFNTVSFKKGEICKGEEGGNVVWIYPKSDLNDAFCINSNVCHRLTMWSQHACSVQVLRVETVNQAWAHLSKYPDDSIKHMVLGGHGDGSTIQWGGTPHGVLGVVGSRKPVYVGSIVSPKEPITENDRIFSRDFVGYVRKVGIARALIWDENDLTPQQISAKNFPNLEVKPSMVNSFFLVLGQKMKRHGTIFADSCLSANSKENPNIAQYIAKRVGKGVRVIGSEVSFGVVRVKRFHAWHGVVEDDRQRTYYAEGAGCPPWAREQRPGGDGNCRCPPGSRCTTAEGGLCPRSDGTTSDEYFLPSCVEGWSQESCRCVPKHIFGKVSLWWTKLFRDTR